MYRLGDESYRLVLDQGWFGAIDLRFRYQETHAWFTGREVYGELRTAGYPPATYLLLWPFLGWLSWPAARVLWFITTAGALFWLVSLVLKHFGGTTRLERACAVFLPLSMHGTGGTIGNGQLLLHILPALIAAAVALRRPASGALREWLGPLLLLWALIKPNAAVPFVWLAAFLPRRVRPFALVVGGYVTLTLLSVAFRDESILELLRGWLRRLSDANASAGYGNIHTWLTEAGLGGLRGPASLVILALLGVWVRLRREADIWLLLGVTAIAARMFVYHRPYDDALILLAMIPLSRIVLAESDSRTDGDARVKRVAAVLLALTWLGAIAPAHYLLQLPPAPWKDLFRYGLPLVWVAVAAFLVFLSGRDLTVAWPSTPGPGAAPPRAAAGSGGAGAG